jgi:hypothetical protein
LYSKLLPGFIKNHTRITYCQKYQEHFRVIGRIHEDFEIFKEVFMKRLVSGVIFSCTTMIILGCGKNPDLQQTNFTKVDSLTDLYLSLQDSMLQSWNVMINDDNQKIEAMHSLLHELMISSPEESDELDIYEEQLNQLTQSRYTQKSLGDEDLIEEYDFASNSLVAELISLAESRREFAYNATLQKLVEDIRIADQRVSNYRQDYDDITLRYNQFLKINHSYLKEISQADSLEMKPVFQMGYDDN